MKPDWKDAPPWANYLARDAYGFWYWFEFEPKPISTDALKTWVSSGRVEDAKFRTPHWDDTLEERPCDS